MKLSVTKHWREKTQARCFQIFEVPMRTVQAHDSSVTHSLLIIFQIHGRGTWLSKLKALCVLQIVELGDCRWYAVFSPWRTVCTSIRIPESQQNGASPCSLQSFPVILNDSMLLFHDIPWYSLDPALASRPGLPLHDFTKKYQNIQKPLTLQIQNLRVEGC